MVDFKMLTMKTRDKENKFCRQKRAEEKRTIK